MPGLYEIRMAFARRLRMLTLRTEPSFLVIGAQKCGTTSLFHYLQGHPQLVAPQRKELDFFDSDNRYQRGIRFYHSHFPIKSRSNAQKHSYEISPAYMGGTVKSRKAANRIYEYNPKIKLIAILRNPIDRAYSAWNMYRSLHSKDPDWFFKWMKRDDSNYTRDSVVNRPANFGQSFEQDITFDLRHHASNRVIESPILEWGLYGMSLEYYLNHFRSEQLHIIFTENLHHSPEITLASIETFLKLSPKDWQGTDLTLHKQGGYCSKLTLRQREDLQTFYAEDVAKLVNLTGLPVPWPEFQNFQTNHTPPNRS